MAYVDGRSVHRMMLNPGNRKPARLVTITEGVCREIGSALAYLHNSGVVHGAVNAKNILASTSGPFLLASVGSAYDFDSGEDIEAWFPLGGVTGVVSGLPTEYAVDGRDDLQALGVVLYTVATGTLPNLTDPDELASGHTLLEKSPLSPAMRDVIHTLLQPDPEDQFASAEDMLAALGKPTRPDRSPIAIPAWTRSATAHFEAIANAAVPSGTDTTDAPSSTELHPPWPADDVPPQAPDAGAAQTDWREMPPITPIRPTRAPSIRIPAVIAAAALVIGVGGVAAYSLTSAKPESRMGSAEPKQGAMSVSIVTATREPGVLPPSLPTTEPTAVLPATATPQPTVLPTASQTPAPTATQTPVPATAAPEPTATEPAPTLTPKPTQIPTVKPRPTSKPKATVVPTQASTATIAPEPTLIPTLAADAGGSQNGGNPDSGASQPPADSPTATAPPIDN